MEKIMDGVHLYQYPPILTGYGFLGYLLEYGYAMIATFVLSLFVLLRKGFYIIHAHCPPDTFVLTAGLISAIFGEELPGPGSIYLGQTLQCLAPVYLGDTVTAKVEVTGMRSDKPIVTFRTTCENQQGLVVLEGEATLIVPSI